MQINVNKGYHYIAENRNVNYQHIAQLLFVLVPSIP